MERLTNSIDFCQMHCDFGRAGGCFFKDKTHCYDNNIYNRLREYEIAEEQGLLLRLPCKVGDTVYTIPVRGKKEIEKRESKMLNIGVLVTKKVKDSL